jgi:hypothetical protein
MNVKKKTIQISKKISITPKRKRNWNLHKRRTFYQNKMFEAKLKCHSAWQWGDDDPRQERRRPNCYVWFKL